MEDGSPQMGFWRSELVRHAIKYVILKGFYFRAVTYLLNVHLQVYLLICLKLFGGNLAKKRVIAQEEITSNDPSQ